MTLKETLEKVEFPEEEYTDGSGKKVGLLNQYREAMRQAVSPQKPTKEQEEAIEQMVREKYRELYGLTWDIIGNTTAQEMIDAEDIALNNETPVAVRPGVYVKNDDKKIIETNFWDTEYALAGKYYLSLNAGCYRLLVPSIKRGTVKEINTAHEVVISRGPAPGSGGIDMFEILFEDGTNSPYVITMDTQMIDRLPIDTDQGWKGIMYVYYGDCAKPAIEFSQVYYRRVKSIPCLKPAGDEK